jgi:hypothetical protein
MQAQVGKCAADHGAHRGGMADRFGLFPFGMAQVVQVNDETDRGERGKPGPKRAANLRDTIPGSRPFRMPTMRFGSLCASRLMREPTSVS